MIITKKMRHENLLKKTISNLTAIVLALGVVGGGMPLSALYAEVLESPNYRIDGASLGGGAVKTSGNIIRFQDGGGGQVVVTSPGHDLTNGDSIIIANTTNYNGTFTIASVVTKGLRGSITAFANAGGGQVEVTSEGHGLANSDEVQIYGTTNYNGLFAVSNVTTNTYEITDTWVSDDGTGTWVYLDTFEITDTWVSDDATGNWRRSNTDDYALFSTITAFSGNPRVTSTSYELRDDNPEPFLANTPVTSCFETTSSGSSNCTTGPSYLNSNGMVRVCGPTGCYNRARFEIDEQNNPSDTLYAVHISDDNFATDIRVIDGTSLKPKDIDNKELADFKSKTAWETPTFNILGLQAGTQYWVRLSALQGDFTETEYGPASTATTADATVTFDIDITDENETTPETASPYSVSMTGSNPLFAGGAPGWAEDLIWLDMETNGNGGVALAMIGQYGGLYSASGPYTITSATADLASTSEGFGLQNYDYSGTETYEETYGGDSDLAEIIVETDYDGTGHNVGIVDTDLVKMYDAYGPLEDGRTAAWVKARASTSASPQTDYTETITFVIVGRY